MDRWVLPRPGRLGREISGRSQRDLGLPHPKRALGLGQLVQAPDQTLRRLAHRLVGMLGAQAHLKPIADPRVAWARKRSG